MWPRSKGVVTEGAAMVSAIEAGAPAMDTTSPAIALSTCTAQHKVCASMLCWSPGQLPTVPLLWSAQQRASGACSFPLQASSQPQQPKVTF